MINQMTNKHKLPPWGLEDGRAGMTGNVDPLSRPALLSAPEEGTADQTHESSTRVSGNARVVAEGTHVTYDLRPDRSSDGAVGTSAMGDAIIAALD